MRRRTPAGSDVRTAYADLLRENIATHPSYAVAERVYAPRLAQIEAGGPVIVRRWNLGGVIGRGTGDAHDWICLEVDGSATRVEPVIEKGSHVDYRRPAGTLVLNKTPAHVTTAGRGQA